MVLVWSWTFLSCLSKSGISLSWPSFSALRTFVRLFHVNIVKQSYFSRAHGIKFKSLLLSFLITNYVIRCSHSCYDYLWLLLCELQQSSITSCCSKLLLSCFVTNEDGKTVLHWYDWTTTTRKTAESPQSKCGYSCKCSVGASWTKHWLYLTTCEWSC